MSVFPGTYIKTAVASTDRFNHLIDTMMTPKLMSFRQIRIHDELAELRPDRATWNCTYMNWLEDAPLVVRKNGAVLTSGPHASDVTVISYSEGTFSVGTVDVGLDGRPRDVVEATYWFDYFPTPIQEGFLTAALSIVNMTAVGPPTDYTIDNFPRNWEGVVLDAAFAMCMEKLLLDYDLWRYRLVFATGPQEVYEGSGGDIVNQITTLKENAESRAREAMQNEKFKTGNYLAYPTVAYYDAIRGVGGARGRHGIPFLSGRLRGWKPTRFI